MFSFLQKKATDLFPTSPSAAPKTTLRDLPDLLDQMAVDSTRDVAVKQIYELSDVAHKQNREVMVCSGKYNVVQALIQCIENCHGHHIACLALNNLSIPMENKRIMALGPDSQKLFQVLCQVIADERPEGYLCCICLMNLSFLEASNNIMLQIVSPQHDAENKGIPILANPQSMLRVLERTILNYHQNINNNSQQQQTKDNKKKSEAARWACGLLRNLSRSEENAVLICNTEIPQFLVDTLRKAPPSTTWASNCMEDFCLFIILNLAQWPTSCQALLKLDKGTVSAIETIMRTSPSGGIQELKATMTCAFLGLPWSTFPSNAGKSIAELINNTLEKNGKDKVYAVGVFKLQMSTKAYRELVRLASKADETVQRSPSSASSSSSSRVSIALNSSTVALFLRIVGDFMLSLEDDEKTQALPKFIPDVLSAEYAVGALEAMLPEILLTSELPGMSSKSEKAADEISSMLLRYAMASSTGESAKTLAHKVAMQLCENASVAKPILEISHELWTQYRRRDGLPLDLFLKGEHSGYLLETERTNTSDYEWKHPYNK